MKFFHYRNRAIDGRLKTAATRWKSGDSERAFEKPEKNWFHPFLKKAGTHFLLFLPVIILFWGNDDNAVLLALLLAFIATTTFSNLFLQIVKPLREERTYLLPLDDSTLDRQIRADLVVPFLKGLFYAMLYGAVGVVSDGNPIDLFTGSGGFLQRVFGNFSKENLMGAITSGLIFIGFLGFLTASLLPRMSWLYQILFFGPIALFFASMVNDQALEVVKHNAHFLPWYHALHHPVSLFGFLATGMLVAWLTRSSWWGVSPFDRTQFYEIYGSPQLMYEIDDHKVPVDLAMIALSKTPKTPKGWLETLIWKWLDIKERALVRAVCGTSHNYLKGWAIGTALMLFLGWLGGLTWPPPFADIKTLALIIFGLFIYSKFLAVPLASIGYLEGISISSQAVGAQFQLLPISLSLLEKLYWKEMLPKLFLLSLTVSCSLALWLRIPSPGDLFLTLIFVIFPTFITGYWFLFWNHSINHWPPNKGKGTLRIKLLQILLIAGMLLFVIGCATFAIPEGKAFGFVRFYPTELSIVFLLILRLPLRSILKDTRCDLMVQA